jgi:hypothetical protein
MPAKQAQVPKFEFPVQPKKKKRKKETKLQKAYNWPLFEVHESGQPSFYKME